jgi:hypothetical protein
LETLSARRSALIITTISAAARELRVASILVSTRNPIAEDAEEVLALALPLLPLTFYLTVVKA